MHQVRKLIQVSWAKALEILAAGGDVDYVGASDVELIGPGESAGSFQEVVIKDQENHTCKVPIELL